MICDGCNKEHHIYCVSPPTKIIPDGAWFCPECQKKGKEIARIQCEDCNFTVGENVFSSQAFAAIQTLQEMAQKQAIDAQADGFSACFAECERPSASSILWDVNGSGSSRSFCCLC